MPERDPIGNALRKFKMLELLKEPETVPGGGASVSEESFKESELGKAADAYNEAIKEGREHS